MKLLYFLQPPLFSFEQLFELEPKNRLREIFSTLDLSPIIRALGHRSHYGPEGYPVEALLRSLVAKQIEGIPTVTQLVERLRCDPAFRYYCGFSAYGSVPSKATFSRLLTRLAKTKAMDALFDALVVQGRKEGIIGTKDVAIDSTEIDAYEKAKPKKDLPSDAQSAAWGSKRDTHGNQKALFGYKTHIACDCKSELPVAIEVTPANVHDSKISRSFNSKVHGNAA